MIFRLACLLVLISQLLLIVMLYETTGPTAILFSFVGTPLLLIGVVLYGVGAWQARRARLQPPDETPTG